MTETNCPRCSSTSSRQDPLRPRGVFICRACGQTFAVEISVEARR